MTNPGTIETRDLLLAAAIFSERGLQRPAGHCALELLRRLPSSDPESDTELRKELEPLVGPEPGYLPGFIQDKIRRLVSVLKNRADSVPVPDPPREEDWCRLERIFGDTLRRLRGKSDYLALSPTDFRNLFSLRPLVQVWATSFEASLRSEGHRVWLDSISRVNQSSGYIWVAYRLNQEMKKVEQATYSLTFTPLGLRAGMVLGGRSRQARCEFYRSLAAGELDEILERLEGTNCFLIDVSWYSTVREKVSLRDYLLNQNCRKNIQAKAAKAETRSEQETMYSWETAIPAILIGSKEFSPEKGQEIDHRLRQLAGPILELISRISA